MCGRHTLLWDGVFSGFTSQLMVMLPCDTRKMNVCRPYRRHGHHSPSASIWWSLRLWQCGLTKNQLERCIHIGMVVPTLILETSVRASSDEGAGGCRHCQDSEAHPAAAYFLEEWGVWACDHEPVSGFSPSARELTDGLEHVTEGEGSTCRTRAHGSISGCCLVIQRYVR